MTTNGPDVGDAGVRDRLRFEADRPAFDAETAALFARAFGPGRHAKAAARLREGAVCAHALSRVAFDADGAIAAACRLWPVEGSAGGRALFLGPIAVEPSRRSAGLGLGLALACVEAAAAAGAPGLVLVGDLAFFARAGFERVPGGRFAMPGPVDPARFLWRPLAPGALDALSGTLRAARA